MTATGSALDADWLGALPPRGRRRSRQMLARRADDRASARSRPAPRQRRRPHAGDRRSRPRTSCSPSSTRCSEQGYRVHRRSPRSAARSTSATPGVRVIIDPIDGSLNAKRGIPHHALSIAVADGATMADVAFGYVYDFGPREEWWARRGEGAWLNGERLDPDARRAPRPRRARSRCSGSSRPTRAGSQASIDALVGHRLPAARARHDRRHRCARSRRRGSTGWSRCATAARSTPPPAS